MIVCHCRAVNHTTVRDVIDSGARCPDEVAERCGAGSVCGGCRPTVESMFGDDDVSAVAAIRLPARRRAALAGATTSAV
jgi:bacterioferritin-associated ferredoxin